MAEEHFEYVSQDDAHNEPDVVEEEQAVEEPQQQDRQEVEQPSEPEQEQPEEEQQEVEEPKQEQKQAPQVDDFTKSPFEAETGFDTNKFFDFAQAEPEKYTRTDFAEKSTAEEQKKEEELDIHTKLYNEVTQEREALTSSAFMWRDSLESALNKGYSYDQAKQYADSMMSQKINSHIERMKEKREFELKSEREKSFYEKELTQRQQEEVNRNSRTNFVELSKKYGGTETIAKYIYNPNIGWPVMEFLYDLSNSGNKENQTQQEYQNAVASYANRILADRQKGAKFLDIIHAQATRSEIPKIVKASRSKQQKTQREISRTKAPSVRQAGSKAASSASTGGAFGAWLGNAPS